MTVGGIYLEDGSLLEYCDDDKRLDDGGSKHI
jgi:hypothetical protein